MAQERPGRGSAAQERRRRDVSEEEARLWHAAMRDVVALPGRRLPPPEPPEPPPALPPPPAPAALLPPPAAPARPAAPPPPPPLTQGKTPGLDRRNADRLRRGEMVIDGCLDLHGMSQEAAHLALLRFILLSADLDRRCLLIITGKGQREGAGVLRSQVPRWLNEGALRPRILAFCRAQQRHGGDGALYVLLKRRR